MQKRSITKQITGVLFTHILVSLMLLFIFVGIFELTDSFWIKAVLSLVGALAYAFIMFSKAYEYATDDLKSYSVLKPYAFKGATVVSATVGLLIVLWVLHAVVWNTMPLTQDSFSSFTVVVNAFYLVMTAPFFAAVGMKGADCNLWGQIISVAVPVASCMAGYYCGYIKWDYVKYLNRFVYETKNKRK